MIKIQPINPDNTPLFDCDNDGRNDNLYEIVMYIKHPNGSMQRKNGCRTILCKDCLHELQTELNSMLNDAPSLRVDDTRFIIVKDNTTNEYYVAKGYCKRISKKYDDSTTSYTFKYADRNFNGYAGASVTFKSKGAATRVFINKDDAINALSNFNRKA